MKSNKKIKILFAIGRLSVGGGEKLLVRQLPMVDRNRFDPHLLTLFSENKDSFGNEVSLAADHWRKLNFKSLFDLPEWFRLLIFLKKEKFDAVVTSLFSANLIVRIAAIILRVPVIISYEHNLYPDKHRWQIGMDRLLAKWTDKIIVDSEAVRKFTSKQEKIPIEKFLTMHIPPLLDSEKSRNPDLVRQELGIPGEAKIILTVSRLVEEKGHRYLIEAAKKVLSEVSNVYFVIVGWGHLEESLKSQAKTLGLGDKVIFPGRIDIRDVLPLADVYVEPAIMTDLPVAIMEALRLEKPIVSTNVGEIPVFVRDRENGFLAEPKNPGLLAEKILILLADKNLREKFGKAGGAFVKNYSLEEYEKKFEFLIHRIFSGKAETKSA